MRPVQGDLNSHIADLGQQLVMLTFLAGPDLRRTFWSISFIRVGNAVRKAIDGSRP